MENRCIYCGDIIPEGRLVCWICEHKIMDDSDSDEKSVRENNVSSYRKNKEVT